MITNKQRAFLRGLANGLDAVLQIGKGGLTPDVTAAVSESLEKRELVKISVLNNCTEDPMAIADALAGRTRSDVVQVIGKKIVLYRPSKTHQAIQLP